MYGTYGIYGPDSDTEEVQDCVSDLRTALAAHGITLPSVGVEPAAFANRPSLPLVALGNCNVDTARRLAAVLRTAWRGEAQQ
jgi:hypothetical protein